MKVHDLLREAGLTVTIGEQDESSGVGSRGELARASHLTQMLDIWGDLVDLATLTDHREFTYFGQRRRPITQEEKRRTVYRRFLRDPDNPDMPYVIPVRIYPEDATRWDRASRQYVLKVGIGKSYMAKISVPDGKGGYLDSVPAVPHFVLDGDGGVLPYGTLTEGPHGKVLTGRTHQCMVLAPKPGRKAYRVIPLGLASASKLDIWNRIVQGLPERNLQKVEPIPHNLYGRSGSPYIVFTPPGLFAFEEEEKPEPDVKEGGEQDTAQETTTYHLGHIWGQTAVLSLQGGIPPYDDEARCTFSTPRVFLARTEETRVVLLYWGRKSEVQLPKGKFDLGGSLDVDPFAALGISILSAHPRRSVGRAFALAKGPYDNKNPLYAYAVKIGLVDPLSPSSPAGVLEMLARRVVETLLPQLEEIRTQVTMALSHAKRPSAKMVLNDQDASEVFTRTSGEDFMASWITERIEGKFFDWTSWLHTVVRQDLLEQIFTRDCVPFSKQQEQARNVSRTRRPRAQKEVEANSATATVEVEAEPEVKAEVVESAPVEVKPEAEVVESAPVEQEPEPEATVAKGTNGDTSVKTEPEDKPEAKKRKPRTTRKSKEGGDTKTS